MRVHMAGKPDGVELPTEEYGYETPGAISVVSASLIVRSRRPLFHSDPSQYFAAILLVIAVYIDAAEFAKKFFYRRADGE